MINIVGIGARAGNDEFTIGGSVNAAILNFTKAMAHRGMREGVRVNAINPGHIETERLTRNVARLANLRGITPDAARAGLLAACGTAALRPAGRDRRGRGVPGLGQGVLRAGGADRHRRRRKPGAVTPRASRAAYVLVWEHHAKETTWQPT